MFQLQRPSRNPGQLAEAVSEALTRFVSGGVVVESNVKYNDAEDEGTPYGPVRVYGYIPVDAAIEETRQKGPAALKGCPSSVTSLTPCLASERTSLTISPTGRLRSAPRR